LLRVTLADLTDPTRPLPEALVGLHRQHVRAEVSNGRLAVTALAAAPLPPLPLPVGDEPVESVLAGWVAVARYPRGVLILHDPQAALGRERMPHALGCAAIALDAPGAESCWDAALSVGVPIYGVTGTIVAEAGRGGPVGLVAALAYGLFRCENGLALSSLREDRRGVAWQCPGAVAGRVIVRGGYEASVLSGEAGNWQDRGNEGFVRVVIDGPAGPAVWLQPRMVMPLPAGGVGCPP
jgi:hypothetical protein